MTTHHIPSPSPPLEAGDRGQEQALANTLRERVAARLVARSREREAEGTGLPESERRALGQRWLGEEWEFDTADRLMHGLPPLDAGVERRVLRLVEDALFGLEGLQRLLDDPGIENIDVVGCDQVFVRYADGRRSQVDPIASSDEALVELLRTVAARAGQEERRFDRATPRLNLNLPDGSRMFALMSVCDRPSVAIRRHGFPDATLPQLRAMGMLTEASERFLRLMVRARRNAVVSGGTNGGKTTLCRALLAEVEPWEKLVTIEDTFELGVHLDGRHPNTVALQAREANLEGVGAIDQAELVRWALRMSPDRVIVGEIRGAEIVPMLNAMSMGNDGSTSTIHASDSQQVFTKLAAYAAQSPERLSMEATNLLVASAVHFVVHLGRDRQGRRCLSSIREVVGADGMHVVSNEIFASGPDGLAVQVCQLQEATQAAFDRAEADLDAETVSWPDPDDRGGKGAADSREVRAGRDYADERGARIGWGWQG
ncbi:pilus assembly protein CpaF [Streptacidiphilus sp. MAP12-16]|uniref:CpaF family protein n=1 Tax=Streptacidiphilus sp. MAP12-16 TaxID=3156300 RepID=UPI003518B602